MTSLVAALLGLGLAGQAESTFCRNPPSRASSDYDRFLKACSDWRERNPGLTVALPDPTAGDPVRPASPPVREGVQRLAAAQSVVHGERGRSISKPETQSSPPAERVAEGVARTLGAS